MASFRFYFLSAVMCCVLVSCQSAVVTTEPTVKIDLPTKQETTPAPETTLAPETTPAPETATPPTTTVTPDTTTKSTTTTTTPPTTTTSTTPPSTTTTTTSTTPAPPTPAPAPPKPPGPPEQGTWAYMDKNNVTCVVVQFAAQLNVTYPKTNASVLGVLVFNVPANATAVAGACGATEQNLSISWPATVDKDNTLTVKFAKNETTKTYELMSLQVTLVPSMFPNISVDSVDLYHGQEWQTPLATSYRCAAPTQLTLTSVEGINVAATLTLTRMQEEAFRTTTGKGFSAARDCAGGDIPDAVPIAVGCALGGMVVVVLVAYLVARHRSAARGYLSM